MGDVFDKRSIEEGGDGEENGLTFHDIKAKGVTDHVNHHSGHLSAKIKAVYNRKPKLVKATR